MPRMTRTKRTSVTFLIASLGLGGAEKQTLQLFNSLDQARFSASLAYLKREWEEHLLSLVTPGRASQVWCADFGRGWDVLWSEAAVQMAGQLQAPGAGVRQPLSPILWPSGPVVGWTALANRRNLPQHGTRPPRR